MASTRIELKSLCLALVSILLIEALAVFAATHTALGGLAITGSARLVELAAIITILFFGNGGLGVVGLTRSTVLKGVRRGIYWSIGFGLLTLVAALVLILAGIQPLSLFRPAPSHAPSHVFLLFLVGALIGPVAEEFFFRGILYGYFRRWGVFAALLISTSLFVFLHPGPNVPLTQTVGGLVFAMAYEIEKNLMVPMLIHVLGNSAIFTLTYLVYNPVFR